MDIYKLMFVQPQYLVSNLIGLDNLNLNDVF